MGAALLDGLGLTSLPVAYLITLALAGLLLVAAELNSRRRIARVS